MQPRWAPSNNPKSLRYTLGANIVLDVLIAASLVGYYIWLVFTSRNVSEGGFAVIVGLLYVLIAAVFLLDGRLLYGFSRQPVGRRLWTYFTITRSVALAGIVYAFYRYAEFDSTIQNSGVNRYVIGIAALAVLFGATGFAFYRTVRGKWQLALLIIVCIASVGAAGYIRGAIANSEKPSANGGLSGTRRDNQTARDFQLISQDIDNYAYKNQQFPASLQQAIDAPDSLSTEENNGVGDRLGRYAYSYDAVTHTFKLCATFSTDTTRSEPESQGFIKAYRHMAGYQCFTFETSQNAQAPSTQAAPPQQSDNSQLYDY